MYCGVGRQVYKIADAHIVLFRCIVLLNVGLMRYMLIVRARLPGDYKPCARYVVEVVLLVHIAPAGTFSIPTTAS